MDVEGIVKKLHSEEHSLREVQQHEASRLASSSSGFVLYVSRRRYAFSFCSFFVGSALGGLRRLICSLLLRRGRLSTYSCRMINRSLSLKASLWSLLVIGPVFMCSFNECMC